MSSPLRPRRLRDSDDQQPMQRECVARRRSARGLIAAGAEPASRGARRRLGNHRGWLRCLVHTRSGVTRLDRSMGARRTVGNFGFRRPVGRRSVGVPDPPPDCSPPADHARRDVGKTWSTWSTARRIPLSFKIKTIRGSSHAGHWVVSGGQGEPHELRRGPERPAGHKPLDGLHRSSPSFGPRTYRALRTRSCATS
jgi:hypothetical protein